MFAAVVLWIVDSLGPRWPEPVPGLVFYGGIDVQQLLCFGTADEVRNAVKTNARAFADCGGYVAANSHSSVTTILPENIHAMCEAARQILYECRVT